MTSDRYDVVVVGGGPGGYVAGIRLGQHGKRTLVIEREALGGVCLNWGCIPSKALIHAGSVRQEVSDFGAVYAGAAPEVNASELQAWKNGIIKKQQGGIAQLLKANGCHHLKANATLTGPHSLEAVDPEGNRHEIAFEQLVLATGSAVIELPAFPLSEPFIGSAKDAVSYDPIPKKLLVIGGGVVGCELGIAYRKLGSEVVIVEMLDRILPFIDKDLLRPINKRMKALGIRVITGAKAESYVAKGAGADVSITLADGSTEVIEADQILVGIGFKPSTQGLGFDAAGLQLNERGWLPVDAQCRTNVPHIFAIGDVTGPPLLAHRASHMAEIAADVIAGHPAAFDAVAMPGGAFTDPEVAQVGLMEEEAKTAGHGVKIGLFPMAALGRAAAMNATEGLIKVVVDETTDVVLGVGICGAFANDLIAEACLAIEMGALAQDLSLTVHAHPTLAEGLMEAAKAARGEAVHVLNRKRR